MIAAQRPLALFRGLKILMIASVLALMTGYIAVEAVSRGMKIMVVGVGGVVGLASLLVAWPLGFARRLTLFGLAFALSVDLSKTFALHVFTEGQFVQNVGGAAGLTFSVVFIGAVVLIVLRLIEGRVPALPMPYIWPWVAFGLVGLATLPIAIDGSLVIWELVRLVMLTIVLVAVADIDPDEMREFLIILAISTGCQGAVAILQYASGSALGLGFLGEQDLQVESVGFETVSRATGTIGNPNILAYFLELQLPTFLALLVVRQTDDGFPGPIGRIIFLGALLAGLGGLGLTLSRAGWLSMGLVLPVVFFLLAGRRLMTRPGLLLVVFLTLALVAAAAYIAPAVMERMFGDDGGSLAQRGPLNKGAMGLIAQSPLLGVGLNNFGPAFAILDTTGNSRVFSNVNHVVHNMYLLVAAEVGLVGLVVFVSIFLLAIRRAVRLYRNSASPIVSALGLGIASGIVAQLLHGLIDPGFRLSLAISQLIFVLLGLLAACERFSKDEKYV